MLLQHFVLCCHKNLPQKMSAVYASTVKLGNKELLGHRKIVPECQMFLIAKCSLLVI